MPSKEQEALVEKAAKAINGPFHPVPVGSPHTLEQLRDIRWQQINDVERRLCLAGAKAAISAILAALQEPTPAMQLVVSANWGRRTWAEYQQVLAASALGEQSE